MDIPDDLDWECDDPDALDLDYEYAKNRWKGKSLPEIENILKGRTIYLGSLLEDLQNMPRTPFIYYFPTVSNYMITCSDDFLENDNFELLMGFDYIIEIVIKYMKNKECSKLWASFRDLVNFLKANGHLFDEYRDGQFSDLPVRLEKKTAEAEHLLAIVQKKGLIKALGQLHGLPLTSISSAGSMPMFIFGELRISPSPRGETRETGDFHLHLQCPWRFVHNASILFGSGDYFCESDHSDESEEIPFDKIIEDGTARWFGTTSKSAQIVHTTFVDDLGGFRIQFNSGSTLEAFPDSFHEKENWRIFIPDNLESHIVCLSNGVTD